MPAVATAPAEPRQPFLRIHPCSLLISCLTQRGAAFPHSLPVLSTHSAFDPRFLNPSRTTQRRLPPRVQREPEPQRGGYLPALLAGGPPASRNSRLLIDRRQQQ